MQRAPPQNKFRVITEESIGLLVNTFYERVRGDDLLGAVFERILHDKWPTHLPRMVDFWSSILLGSGRFQGNVFGKHMALEGIETAHFVRWLALFKSTVMALFEGDEATRILEVADRIAGSLQLGFFGIRDVRM